MSIVATDFYGLPLKIGDFVIPFIFNISGNIGNIYKTEGRILVSIFNEKQPIYHLSPSWLTTQERFDEHNRN